jgi:hypothetical protein
VTRCRSLMRTSFGTVIFAKISAWELRSSACQVLPHTHTHTHTHTHAHTHHRTSLWRHIPIYNSDTATQQQHSNTATQQPATQQHSNTSTLQTTSTATYAILSFCLSVWAYMLLSAEKKELGSPAANVHLFDCALTFRKVC